MNPGDLNAGELLVLLTLARLVVYADGVVDEAEKKELAEICIDVGLPGFEWAKQQADTQNLDLEGALELAAGVRRAGVRELIKTMLHDLAGSDGHHPAEAEILARVAQIWRS